PEATTAPPRDRLGRIPSPPPYSGIQRPFSRTPGGVTLARMLVGRQRGQTAATDALSLTEEPSLRAELGYWRGCFEFELGNLQRAYDLMLETARSVAEDDPAFAALIAAEATLLPSAPSVRDRPLPASAAARAYARRARGRGDPFIVVMRAFALIESGRVAA